MSTVIHVQKHQTSDKVTTLKWKTLNLDLEWVDAVEGDR